MTEEQQQQSIQPRITLSTPPSSPRFPEKTYSHERRRSSVVDSLRQLVSLDDTSTLRSPASAVVIHYEKATPASAPGVTQNPPDILTRTNSTSSCSYEKDNGSTSHGKAKLNLLSYVNIVIPWTVTISFIYMVLAVVPLAITHLCSSCHAQDWILLKNRQFFAVHALRLQLGKKKSASGAAIVALLSPFVALVVVLLGLLAAVGWFYSIMLSEHDDQTTCLNLALSLWRTWLTIFYEDEAGNCDDMV